MFKSNAREAKDKSEVVMVLQVSDPDETTLETIAARIQKVRSYVPKEVRLRICVAEGD
jgi:hypothetical protein